MRIVKLTANNVKRLVAVEINPKGDVVTISGKNGAGKTSILDAIEWALVGTKAQSKTPQPIRAGENYAQTTLEMDDIIVKREWKGENQTLTVTSKDGAKYSSPQKFLDEKIGALSFDPLAFAQKDDKDQVAALLKLVELPFDPKELDGKRLTLYDARTEAGRELRSLEAQLEAIEAPDEATPGEEISVADLTREYSDASDLHLARANFASATERLEEDIHAKSDDLERLRALVDSTAKQVEEMSKLLADRHTKKSKQPELPDLESIQERMASATELNRQIRAKQEHGLMTIQVGKAKREVEAFTKEIEDLDASKSKALSEVKMPVEGVSFDEEGVSYNGIPFRQASAAEQLRVSVGMAMAANPTIRIIRITDGSLLDEDNLALIAEMAADQDYQVWLERVESEAGVGFVIEDGMVVSDGEIAETSD